MRRNGIGFLPCASDTFSDAILLQNGYVGRKLWTVEEDVCGIVYTYILSFLHFIRYYRTTLSILPSYSTVHPSLRKISFQGCRFEKDLSV